MPQIFASPNHCTSAGLRFQRIIHRTIESHTSWKESRSSLPSFSAFQSETTPSAQLPPKHLPLPIATSMNLDYRRYARQSTSKICSISFYYLFFPCNEREPHPPLDPGYYRDRFSGCCSITDNSKNCARSDHECENLISAWFKVHGRTSGVSSLSIIFPALSLPILIVKDLYGSRETNMAAWDAFFIASKQYSEESRSFEGY